MSFLGLLKIVKGNEIVVIHEVVEEFFGGIVGGDAVPEGDEDTDDAGEGRRWIRANSAKSML